MRSEDGQPESERTPVGWGRLYPELMRWGNVKERRRALNQAERDAFRDRWVTAICFWIIGAVVTVGQTRFTDVGGGPAWVRFIGMFVPALITIALFFFAYLLWQRQRVQTSLRRQLASMAGKVCIDCGYDLRGNVSGRCPECGTKIST